MRYEELYNKVKKIKKLRHWQDELPQIISNSLDKKPSSKISHWREVLASLPQVTPSLVDLTQGTVQIGQTEDCSEEIRDEIRQKFYELHPWRKGPFSIFGIHIDTEWRSDWKWDRLKDHISPLTGKKVLDIGCGNGYHCWRMLGSDADLVIGVEPLAMYVLQFWFVAHFVRDVPIFVIPCFLENMPSAEEVFDTVFSMGVLYHRRSPIDHLLQLKSCLKKGGELVLETLVIDGKLGEVLVPEDRYAKMRNTWFLPSTLTLESWMKRCGFQDIRLVDVTTTTTEEQRKTDWMTFDSLADFLHPENPNLTIEGHPAPLRAIFVAKV